MEDATRRHGAFSWNELMTNDVEGAKAFYGELLGWTLKDTACSLGSYTVASIDEQEAAGIMAIPKEMEGMPPAWGAYVTVDDVDAAAARVEQLGGKVCVPPQDIPEFGRFVCIQDPQGAMLMLVSYLAQD